MGTRILTFHHQEPIGNETRIGPTYYIEADYIPTAVRIYAEFAPVRDAKINIFDDGVTIFENRTPKVINNTSGKDETGVATVEAVLSSGCHSTEFSGNLKEDPIEEGSWVHCNLVDAGGSRNFTVHLEVKRLSSEDESL